MDDAKKQHTVVIGGTRGTGRVLVRYLAGENHVLSVIGRRPPSELDQRIPATRYWVLDLLDRKRLPKTWVELISHNGKINNLVFFQRFRGEGDDWSGEIETSLTATKDVIELSVDEFAEADDKSIVIVSSIASHLVASEQPVSYHVAKAGLNQMVRYYAVALGPKGIRVNAVSPGIVLKEESGDFYLKSRELQDLYKRITPLGRMGTSQEIASVVSFLCSSKASFITGQNIVVDGGISLQWHETLARKLTALDHPTVTREGLD
jgi:NAD(P)-dependent dehydrogenase (short-subunit alcohol dehydrogenase family)